MKDLALGAEVFDVGHDALDKLARRAEVAAAYDLGLKQVEEDLDQVKPGRVGRDGVELDAVVARPGVPDGDFRRVMGVDVVQDDLDLTHGVASQDFIHDAVNSRERWRWVV